MERREAARSATLHEVALAAATAAASAAASSQKPLHSAIHGKAMGHSFELDGGMPSLRHDADAIADAGASLVAELRAAAASAPWLHAGVEEPYEQDARPWGAAASTTGPCDDDINGQSTTPQVSRHAQLPKLVNDPLVTGCAGALTGMAVTVLVGLFLGGRR